MSVTLFKGELMQKLLTSCFTMVFLIHSISFSNIDIFNKTPDWESNAKGYYSTGLGVADVNNDGWDDIVVASGNDMGKNPLSVYYNNGDGTFPKEPSWESSDKSYHGQLSIGDIDGNGFPDVAVSVFVGNGGMSTKGWVKIYYNNNGELEKNPSFKSSDIMYTFSCALGDADGDGDLDLAVACGNGYSSNGKDNARIYFNENGKIQTSPGWKSETVRSAMDVEFFDMDMNGYLDLILACDSKTPNTIYLADNTGKISTKASWECTDNGNNGNSLTINYIDDNKFPDLVVSHNNQLGGVGGHVAYLFDKAPSGTSDPAWKSHRVGNASAVITEDLDDDNIVDFIGGSWGSPIGKGPIEIFKGDGKGFSTAPVWSSNSGSVLETYVLRDVDQKGRYKHSETITIENDNSHTVHLSKTNIEKITEVSVNGKKLTAGKEYCLIDGGSWISTKDALKKGDNVKIKCLLSYHRDLIASNWDRTKGNYLFYNKKAVSTSHIPNAHAAVQHSVTTLQKKNICNFVFNLKSPTNIQIDIYSLQGKHVRMIYKNKVNAGEQYFQWNWKESNKTLSNGLYIYKIKTHTNVITGNISLY